MALNVGNKFPQFRLRAVEGRKFKDITLDNVFVNIDNSIYEEQQKWMVIFFYPKDFSTLCPNEIDGFAQLHGQFAQRDCVLLAVSTDSEMTHWAWRKNQEELRNLTIPMLSDIKRDLSMALGVLDENEGTARRATFIVDPNGIIKFNMTTDYNVGRNPHEVLRVLDALQTKELCPCDWQKGDQTISRANEYLINE